MICPNCGAPMRLEVNRDYFTCEYCGYVHRPEANCDGIRVLGGPTSEACPICAVPLVEAGMGGYRMRYCTHCQGVLISMDAFLPLILELRSRRQSEPDAAPPADKTHLDRRIRCPQCGNEMDTHRYGGPGNVIIDDCEHCRLNWLDSGELRRIVTAPDRYYGEPNDVAP